MKFKKILYMLLFVSAVFGICYAINITRSNNINSKAAKIVIIGGTSGIGKALMIECVAKGYKVGVTCQTEELLNNLKSNLGDKISVQVLDFTLPSQAHKRLNDLIDAINGIDVLIMNPEAFTINPQLDFQIQKNNIDHNMNDISSFSKDYFMKKGKGHIIFINYKAGLMNIVSAKDLNLANPHRFNTSSQEQAAREICDIIAKFVLSS